MNLFCPECNQTSQFDPLIWRCTCGGAWEIVDLQQFNMNKIHVDDWTVWRYGELLGLDIVTPLKAMGVGWTPLVPIRFEENNVLLKLEYLMPSGSFKDRGVNTMINQLASMGVHSIIEDSSGNAGASVAAHGARFGIHTKIFVPENTSQNKIKQINIYGAEIIKVAGTRKDVEEGAQNSIGPNAIYASHAYNPAYLAGQTTLAFEIWEQLEGKIPDWVVCPLGQGGEFLGLWIGFSKLLNTGLIDRLPRLVAVQPTNNNPVYQAWKNGLDYIPAFTGLKNTLAEGAAIANPIRGKRILQGLKESNGLVMSISEREIQAGQYDLARLGFFVEPTSALVVAAFRNLANIIKEDETTVLTLTGNGLKGDVRIK